MNQPTFLENEAPSTEKNDAIQQDFLEISDKIKNNPDTINKITEHTLKNVDTYLTTNKDQAQQMLLDISDTMQKNPNLEKKDANSLRELQKLCIAKTTWEEVGTYQLHKDVLNATFDLAKLTTYGSLFQTGNTNNWFANITETYIQGANPKFDELFTTGEFKNVYFSPAQLQKELYKKNTERRNTLVASMKSLTPENITNFMTSAKITKIEDITGNSPYIMAAIKTTFPTITDAYREFKQILVKDPTIMKTWTDKISTAKDLEAKDIEAKKIKENQDNVAALPTTFTQDIILKEYLNKNNNDQDPIYTFNNGINSNLGDIVTLLTDGFKTNQNDEKTNGLMTLLKAGDLKGFQAQVYGENPSSKYKTDWKDGKLGDETLQVTKAYLGLATDKVDDADTQDITPATGSEAKPKVKAPTEQTATNKKIVTKQNNTKETGSTKEQLNINIAQKYLENMDNIHITEFTMDALASSKDWILKMKDGAEKTKFLALADNNISKLNNYKKFKNDFSKRYNNPKVYLDVDSYTKRFDNDVFSDTRLLDHLLIYEKAVTLMSMIKLPANFWGKFTLNRKNLSTFINNADKDTFDKADDVFHEADNKSFMRTSNNQRVKFADNVKSFEVDGTDSRRDLKFVNVETFFERLNKPTGYLDNLYAASSQNKEGDYIVDITRA